ncbi:MAG: Asp-tRNA(Asn)/Glu-tRNA(Gln) amidotransferase subunit GatC [Patescibacteria group bacterium]
MLKIKKEELLKLASLSRIELSEEELGSFGKDIDSILSFVKQIQEVSGSAKSEKRLPGVFSMIQNSFREDTTPHKSGEFSKEILAEVPQREGDYVKVKKIL